LVDAIVRVNDADVGNPPVEFSRNAGRYRVTVTRKGYVPYEWWSWTAVGVVVVGAGAGTYALARSNSTPSRPPPDGGGLGWSLKVP
jgi:hypothetical protein